MNKPHKRLEVWKQSMDLVVDIYQVTEKFPKSEAYGLTSQIRRAVLSVPSNIAEGAARQTKKEFINFLHIAQGSLSELDTQIELAYRLCYVNERTLTKFDSQMEQIDRMITGLIRHLSKQ